MPSNDILIIEDSDVDFETVHRLFQEIRPDLSIGRASDGDEAIEMLQEQASVPGRRRTLPSLILLDLNLPTTSGHEVIATLKAQPELRGIPIVVLSTSSNPRDVTACYDSGVSSYMIKPVDLPLFRQIVRLLCEYWFATVTLAEK